MIFLMMVVICGATEGNGPTVGAEQFLSLVRSQHTMYRDVFFLYEGDFRYVGPEKLINVNPQEVGYEFQGTYLFRQDGAVRQELFKRPFQGDRIISRSDVSVLNGKAWKRSVAADLYRNSNNLIRESNGAAIMLFKAGSAKRMLFSWFFDSLSDPSNQGYRFLGWEDIDGHRCLCVQLNSLPGEKEPSFFQYRMWIDLERGGHPLKFETIAGSAVRARSSDIRLEALPTEKGQKVWMPVTAKVETFLWGDKDYTYPFFRETYAIVNGSFRLNQGCTDKDFNLREKQKPLGDITLQSFRTEFDQTPVFRTDPEGVQARLDKLLKEADDVSKQLEAGAPAVSLWEQLLSASLGFVALGICTLTGAVMWKRRIG